MQNNSADDIIRNITAQLSCKHINYLTEEDLSIGLLRLQDTYEMDTKDIAERRNPEFSNTNTTGDCFEIGRVAYQEYDYYHMIIWMQEARKRLAKKTVPMADLEDILKYSAFLLYVQIRIIHPLAKANMKICWKMIRTQKYSRICYYKMNRPYLPLAPFKAEIVSQNPLPVTIL